MRPQTADLLNEALVLHRRGALAEADARYSEVLRAEPDNADAHYYLGMMRCQEGRFAEGAELARKALASNPRHARAHVLLGRACNGLGRNDEALTSLEQAIALAPDLAQAHSHLADILSDLGRNAEAIDSYRRALVLAPDAVEDRFNYGLALRAVGRQEEAVESFDRAIAGKPDFAKARLARADVLHQLHRNNEALDDVDRALAIEPHVAEAWHSRGNILSAFLGRNEDALSSYERALALKPELAEGWLSGANILSEFKRHDKALAAYDKALELKPDIAGAWLGRGNVNFRLKRYHDALGDYDRALELEPDLAAAWLGRGIVYFNLRSVDALAAFDKALALSPDLAEAWVGRGNVFSEIKRHEEALFAFDRAVALKPDLAVAWLGRGKVFLELQRYDDALAAYDRALALVEDVDYAAGFRLHVKQQMCDWKTLEQETAQLLSTIRQGKSASFPFVLLATSASAADQLQCARHFVQGQPSFPPVWRGEIYSHDRIRIAYLSSELREHAVAYLTAGLFEHHDRMRFEVTALSFEPGQDSDFCRRITAAFDRFLDVHSQGDEAIAALIRRLEIDIVVDLNGFTRNGRLGVFARRPAPLQVNYLGYAGTMGADCYDYIVADPVIIPREHFKFYSEKVAWLPDSFLAGDAARPIADRTAARSALGLPDKAFVFCAFNQSFKIGPEIFDVWMRLLRAVDGSVLWLKDNNASATRNLRLEAMRRGVPPERLIFAPPIPLSAEHLARHRQADLFVDTLHYNAHTTASDALWTGLPVVTCLGSTFAGRVAASLLQAIGLPELVTTSLEDYEALALKLARDPALLASVKARLARNRGSYPLFDTARFTRHIEAAFTTMWERHQKGEAPSAFAVEPID